MSEDPNKLNYVIVEKIPLKNDSHYKYNEDWVKNRIQENPELLGLGDLVIMEREKKQKYGILDFLMKDPENKILYEVEVQLGKTDPSHILRSIEYWKKTASPESFQITEKLVDFFKSNYPDLKIIYRGGVILVRTSLNCVWWYPRKRNPTIVLGIRIPIESVEIHTQTLGDIGILPRIDPRVKIAYMEMTITLDHIENNFDDFSSIIKEAIDFSLK